MKKTETIKKNQANPKIVTKSQRATVDFKTKSGKVLRVDAIKTCNSSQNIPKKSSSGHQPKNKKK